MVSGLALGYFGATGAGGFDVRVGLEGFSLGAGAIAVQIGLLITVYVNGKRKDAKSDVDQKTIEASKEQLMMQRQKYKQMKTLTGWMILLLSCGFAWGVRDWLDVTVSKTDAWVLPISFSYLLIFIVFYIYALNSEIKISGKIKKS